MNVSETKQKTEEEGSHEGPAYRKGIEGVRLIHQAAVASQIARQSKHNEDLRQHMNKEHTGVDGCEGEDLNLYIDSPQTHIHEEKSKKGNGLLKAAAGAALLATGVGGGAGLAMLLQGGKEVVDDVSPQLRYMLDVGGGQEVASE